MKVWLHWLWRYLTGLLLGLAGLQHIKIQLHRLAVISIEFSSLFSRCFERTSVDQRSNWLKNAGDMWKWHWNKLQLTASDRTCILQHDFNFLYNKTLSGSDWHSSQIEQQKHTKLEGMGKIVDGFGTKHSNTRAAIFHISLYAKIYFFAFFGVNC